MDKSKHVFIVRVDMRRVKTELRYKKTIYPAMRVKTPKNLEELYNRAQALDFEGDIMTFVIDRVRETPSQYHVMFEGQAFSLDKRNLDDRWFRFNDVFEFRLCKTALDMWQAIYSYYHNLHEQVMKSRTGAPTSEWQTVEEK